MEPLLQLVTGEQLTHRTANREDGARLGVMAERFGVEIANVYLLMYRCLTPSCKAIVTPLWLRDISGMSWRREELTKRDNEKLSPVPSPH